MSKIYTREEVTVMLCTLHDELLQVDTDDGEQRAKTMSFIDDFLKFCDEPFAEFSHALG